MKMLLASTALSLGIALAGAAAAAPPRPSEPPWGAYCTDCRSTPWSTWSTAAAFGGCVLAVAWRRRRHAEGDPD